MVDAYYKAVCAELLKLGYNRDRNTKGSHEKWVEPQTAKFVIVPRNLYSRHTANGIMKDAGSARKF